METMTMRCHFKHKKFFLFVLLAVVLAGYLLSLKKTVTIVFPRDEIKQNLILAEVTAYSELDSCHYENCVMSSGRRAYIGAVACPRNIALGTLVEISGEVYTCEDRTAKRYDGRFDIFMGYAEDSYHQAIDFGIKSLEVLVLR